MAAIAFTPALLALLALGAEPDPGYPGLPGKMTGGCPSTFMGIQCVEDLDRLQARFAVLGVPWDSGTSARPGARFGPKAVRARWPWGQQGAAALDGYHDFDTGRAILQGVTMVDVGDVLILPSDFQPNFDRITTTIRKVLAKGAVPIVIGGDHSVTFPVLRGFDGLGGKLHVVHFDAHLDFSDGTPETRLSHAHAMRRASELPFVSGITNIGVRGLGSAEDLADGRRRKVFDAIPTVQALAMGMKKAVAAVPRAERYYVTIDVDVLDPSVAPGTGTPVPGGLSYLQLREALHELAARGGVVGFDVVEYSPAYDSSELTATVVESLIAGFAGDLAAAPRRRP